ncbi:site-specific integrase [Bacteroides sp. BFG-638]|uniref:Site-specific integrase n=1 Tax=Bacteroides vicugnae TaxID=3037989 RepID=A0ABU5HU51_9BACE|nr:MULTISPECIES: site-specific integrase [Bacteroides]MBV3833197.1 site-specific integrase [Bacteroides xylanisolvens]MBV3876038.1 site-specific integrase [Bacteroides xylanisolvens]MBV3881318.1 site-specific integrase [Bacteroides xylanisolvens]MBV3907443.1 site-specific integrase [Bacteroides xylanisolvens]MBV3912789.1 site-specific integrase [Bacteroides xylanisolvens]
MTTSVRLMLNKGRRLNNGTYPLVFQVIHSRRKKLLYTGFRLKEEAFNEAEEKIVDGTDATLTATDITKMNRELRKMKNMIHTRIRQLERTTEPFTVEDVLAQFTRANVRQQFYILRYIDTQIERKKKLKKEGTAAAYKSTRSSLAKFLDGSDIRMPEIDLRFIRRYEDFLYNNGVAENTVSYYLRNLRTLYNQAVVDGYHPHGEYPFVKAQTRPAKTVKRALSREDLQALANLKLEDAPELKFARDLYLFSFYAQGMAFVDIVLLKKSDIYNGVLTYSRHKSKQFIRIAVTPQMQELMDKYETEGKYVFPIIRDNSSSEYTQYRLALGRINRHLKRIAAMIDVKIPLTTYTARHTWATLARDCGAPVSVISAGLGHTSEEMTRIYLKEFDVSQLDKVNSIVTKLF